MRKTPTILAAVFILITLVRVAEFSDTRMKAGLLGWLFSVALGAGVYFFSWFTREHVASRQTEDGEKADKRSVTVQRWAWGGLAFFVVVDGVFNGAEVWLSVEPKTLLMIVTALIYGLFPTLAAAALGALQGHVDRLPQPPPSKNAIVPALRRMIASRINSMVVPDMVDAPIVRIPKPHMRASSAHLCEACEMEFTSQQALAAHKRWKHPVNQPNLNGKVKDHATPTTR